MRGATHHFVRSMTAGMALITCREALLVSITNNLKQVAVWFLIVMLSGWSCGVSLSCGVIFFRHSSQH